MTRSRRLAGGWAVAIFLLLLPVTAAGQGWIVDVSAGAAEYDALSGDVGTVNAIFGVRREGPVWLSLSGGAPLDSAALPWIAGGAGTRLSRWFGNFEVGVHAAALGFGYRVSELGASGGGATLIGLPFVAFGRGGARVEGRSGVMHHISLFDGASTPRTILDNSLRGSLSLSPAVSFVTEGRLVSASEGSFPFAGAGLEFSRGPATAWVHGGRWLADELDTGGWSAGAQVSLPKRLSLRASFAREPEDPLYWNGSRTLWTVGLSRALGAPVSYERSLPPPESFRRPAGTVQLRIDEGEVDLPSSDGSVSVAGDFTGWKAVPMRRRDGAWEASFDLAPGVYRYSFRLPDGSWFLPDSVRNRVDDGFGGVNGVLVVVAS